MPITYAGVEFNPPNESYLAFYRQWWHGHRIREWTFEGFNVSWTDHLPLPAPAACEPPAVSRLHWPTGASRWAYCHLVATGTKLIQLRAALGNGPGLLNFTDVRRPPIPGAGAGLGTSMWMLPPRPMSQKGGNPSGVLQNADELYLLTLVDERWWWWQVPFIQDTPSTWDGLLTNLLGLVGVTPALFDSVSADYGVPWAGRWDRWGKPLPLLIDAACKTVGRRLVRGLDGAVAIQSAATAAAADQVLWDTWNTECETGGRMDVDDIARTLPASITVVFPGQPPGALTEATGGGAAQYGRVIADKAAVDPEGGHAAYAARAAADTYAWGFSRTDATFRGFINRVPTGLDDFIEYAYPPSGELVTRVVRRPYNEAWAEGGVAPPLFFPAELTSGYDPADGYTFARLTLDVAAPDYVSRSPGFGDLRLFELSGREDLLPGVRVYVFRNPDGRGWEFFYPTVYRDDCVGGVLVRQKKIGEDVDDDASWVTVAYLGIPCAGGGAGSGPGSGDPCAVCYPDSGDGGDPVVVIDVECVAGSTYVVSAQQAITWDAGGGRARLTYYNLTFHVAGCCDCPAGSGAPGSGGGTTPCTSGCETYTVGGKTLYRLPSDQYACAWGDADGTYLLYQCGGGEYCLVTPADNPLTSPAPPGYCAWGTVGGWSGTGTATLTLRNPSGSGCAASIDVACASGGDVTACSPAFVKLTVSAAHYPCDGGGLLGPETAAGEGPEWRWSHGGGFGPAPGMGFGCILQCNLDGTFNVLPWQPPYAGGTAYYAGPPPTYGIPGPLPITVAYTQTDADCSDSPLAVSLLFENA